MKKVKPVYISILTIVVFAIGMFVGVKTDWWILEGRKTPLDLENSISHSEDEHIEDTHSEEAHSGEVDLEQEHSEDEHSEDEHSDEEEHEEKTEITGSSTVQNAYDLGLTKQQLEEVLGSGVDNPEKKIKDIATAKGLSFGNVKDELNSLIGR